MKKPQKPTIAFLTHDWSWGTDPLQPNGCAWYRCKLPSDELNKRGWFSAVGFPGFNEARGFGLIVDNDKAVHGWDILVFKLLMQKEVLDAIPKARAMGQKIVVDVDDWFDGLAKSNRAHEATDPKKNPNANREIYAQIIMAADAVITSTPFLFDYYGQRRDNVFLVRNGIDLGRWKKRNIDHNKRTSIGWVGATHWRSNDLEQLSGFIGQFIEENNLRFHHSGHNTNAPHACDLFGISTKNARLQLMVPILSYPSLFREIDIGLIPLNNIPFNHAKSYIKGLEYAASGVPFVSSYSPEYEILTSGEFAIGRMAKTEKEWKQHLTDLLDPAVRKNDSSANYKNLVHYSMDARGDDWDATMRFIKENI